MKDQEYILKKFVKAQSITEAIEKDAKTPISEIYLASDKPENLPAAIGFLAPEPELSYEY